MLRACCVPARSAREREVTYAKTGDMNTGARSTCLIGCSPPRSGGRAWLRDRCGWHCKAVEEVVQKSLSHRRSSVTEGQKAWQIHRTRDSDERLAFPGDGANSPGVRGQRPVSQVLGRSTEIAQSTAIWILFGRVDTQGSSRPIRSIGTISKKNLPAGIVILPNAWS